MQRSRRTFAVVALAAMALAVSIGIALRISAPPSDDSTPNAEAVPPRAAPVLASRLPAELNAIPTDHQDALLPASLRNTDPDGWIGVDDDGHLVITPGARWFFDYYLSASGEEPAEDIRARLIGEIERRLPPTGAREAVALLDRYLAYRERVRDAQAAGTNGDLVRRLEELHQIRVDVFGASDAAILFGEEEQVQRADLQRRTVMSDASLTAEERERQLHDIEQQLPAAIRAARADTFAPLHLRQDEQALREAGGTDDDIHVLREQRFGAEAAARLAALDYEQAAWQQRVNDYRRARRTIETDATLSDATRAAALDALIKQRFTQQEHLRAKALEQQRPIE